VTIFRPGKARGQRGIPQKSSPRRLLNLGMPPPWGFTLHFRIWLPLNTIVSAGMDYHGWHDASKQFWIETHKHCSIQLPDGHESSKLSGGDQIEMKLGLQVLNFEMGT
jgi:hypothetical protein